MISLFIPERIGSYYIFGKKVAAFEIGQTEIHVAIATLKGHTRTIEKILTERIETDSALGSDERIIEALKKIGAKLGPVDEITYALPSSQVIFKELSLPFTGEKKIKMVVPYEVESLLPFTLDTAILDSIITKKDPSSHHADIIVAAVKKDQIGQATNLFAAAGLALTRVTVDMLELYGLYSMLHPKNDIHTKALIDLGFYNTRLAIIVDGQLRYIRSIPKGLVTVAKKMSTLNATETADNLKHLLGFGINETNNQALSQARHEALEELITEITATIDSFTKKMGPQAENTKLILTGPVADIPGISDFFARITRRETTLFQSKQLLHNPIMQSKVTPLPNNHIISIATAVSSPVTQDFNLQQAVVEKQEDMLINYQLISIAALTGLIFLSLSLYSFFRLRSLRLTYKNAQTEAINELRKNFKLQPSQTANLQAANRAALNELKKEESAWHRLSTENRFAFLNYLTELSRCINLKDTQLSLASIHLKEDTIKLYGSVPGYQQLTRLQNELECPLFKKLPKLQDWNFKSEPITLTVNKEEL